MMYGKATSAPVVNCVRVDQYFVPWGAKKT